MLADEDTSMTHALVEFEEEACTAVVPLNRVIGLKNSVKGEVVSVLWNNKKEYLGRFIVSGMATFVTYDDWGGGEVALDPLDHGFHRSILENGPFLARYFLRNCHGDKSFPCHCM